MTQDKKQAEQITNMEMDFVKWLTDVCRKAELTDYSSVKGMLTPRPYGYAIQGNFQKILDKKFKETGHESVYLLMLIPENLFQKERDHVGGPVPKCAQVIMDGSEKLKERYCIRPTSETLFCEHCASIIHSHRDLPKLYNQWYSVLRQEGTFRSLLHHREFLWQEGHTMYAAVGEIIAETECIFNIHADFYESYLVIPAVKGREIDREKFSGARATYTVECMIYDKKAFQASASHYFDDGFARASDVTFAGKDNQPHHPFQTSWGVSTRLIGGVIMTHGDNSDLVLPPRIAPTQAIIAPVTQRKEGVIATNRTVMTRLKAAGIRVKMDTPNNSPGWRLAKYEMKGVPLRPELGSKDIEKSQRILTRRDSSEKVSVFLDNIEEIAKTMPDAVRRGLFDKAKRNLDENICVCTTLEEVEEKVIDQGGFVKIMWCGELICELKMKEEAGVSFRCIPPEQEHLGDTRACCGKSAKHMMCQDVAC